MVGESVQDVWDFYGCHRAASCEEEVVFVVVRVLQGYERRKKAGDLGSVDVVFGMDHL